MLAGPLRDRFYFVLVTPRIFKSSKNRFYTYKMQDYQGGDLQVLKQDLLIGGDLSDEDLRLISRKIGWVSWEDLIQTIFPVFKEARQEVPFKELADFSSREEIIAGRFDPGNAIASLQKRSVLPGPTISWMGPDLGVNHFNRGKGNITNTGEVISSFLSDHGGCTMFKADVFKMSIATVMIFTTLACGRKETPPQPKEQESQTVTAPQPKEQEDPTVTAVATLFKKWDQAFNSKDPDKLMEIIPNEIKERLPEEAKKMCTEIVSQLAAGLKWYRHEILP